MHNSDARTPSAREKRELARRARRLALSQAADDDRLKLTRFAEELEKEAEALEQQSATIWLPPGNELGQIQHDEVQHSQSIDAASLPPAADKKD